MTLAMITRATLGHAGRALVASTATKVAYAAIMIALFTRVAMSFLPAFQTLLLHAAACAWVAAFGVTRRCWPAGVNHGRETPDL